MNSIMNSLCLIFIQLLLASAFSQSYGKEVCAGCPVEQDPNGKELQGLMSGALATTNSGLSLVGLKKCTSQVVAGIKYTCEVEVQSPHTNGVQTCTISLLSQPWISKEPQVLSESCSQVPRAKREVCDGCPYVYPKDKYVQGLMSGALASTNSGLNFVGVKKCTAQVVAGMKYTCEVEVQSPRTNGVQTCTISLLSQPWISKEPQVLSESCSQVPRAKRAACPGCPFEADPQDKEVQGLMSGALASTNSGLNFVGIKKCTAQVVAGMKYTCEVEVQSPHTNGVQTCTISLVSQPWISKEPQVLSESCSQVPRAKRAACPGCPFEADPQDKQVQGLMSTALASTNSGLNLVGIKKCTAQVVAGMKYTCEVEVQSPHTNGVQTCTISLLSQPWISKEPQVLSESCSQVQRAKRAICTGCPYEADPKSKVVQGLMSGALATTNSGLNFVGLKKCTAQVAAGIKYTCEVEVQSPHTNGVQTCTISLVSQSWISKVPHIISESCSQVPRAKREVCAGCPVEQDPNDQEIKGMMNTALATTNSGLNLVGIKLCTSQVVSGIKYSCELEVQSPHTNGVQTCSVSLLLQPWMSGTPQLLSESCTSHVVNFAKTGATVPVNTDSETVTSLLGFLSNQITQKTNADNIIKITKTLSASVQVVSGRLVHMKVLVGESNCPVKSNTNPANCTVSKASHVCDVSVWEQPWLHKRQLNEFSCQEI